MTTEQRERAQKNIELCGLQDLFARADAEGAMFRWAGDSEVLLTSYELRLELANDKFRHGPVNWALVNPKNILSSYDRRIEKLRAARAAFAKRVGLE